MITRNLYRLRVFNGMQGTVLAIQRSPDVVRVQVDGGQVVPIQREIFTKINTETGTVMASRAQIPLRLSYAVTGKMLIFFIH
jgi:ATP-dependent exoDNAse (exonuclease V) alpha subunit